MVKRPGPGCWPALLAAALLMPAWTAAEPVDVPTLPAPPPDALAAPGTHWYAFASPFYLPETRLGLGVVAGVHRPLCAGCQPSSVHLEAAYTLNHQVSVTLNPRLFTSPSFALGLSFHYALFPDRFFGIGPTAGDAGEPFTPRSLEVMVTPEWYVIAGRLRVGPKLHLRREQVVSREPGGQLASGTVYGVDGYAAAGFGASVTWDTRDSQFFPRGGTYGEGWYVFYPGAIGRHRDFGRAALDASHFVRLGGDHVLALNGSVALTHGDAPFTLLARLGGVHAIRGYYDGRYRDRFSYGAQAEYRFPIWWRLRGAAFAAAGDVGPTLTAFRPGHVRAAGGGGLRFRLTDDGVHLRVDVASSGGEPDVYMIVLEAF